VEEKAGADEGSSLGAPGVGAGEVNTVCWGTLVVLGEPMGVGLEGGLLAVPEQPANSMNPVTITAATDRFIGS
jgi:hypothetical protein